MAQLPPWISQQAAPNPAEAYIRSLGIGAQLGESAARLQQQQEQFEVSTEASRKEMEQRQLLEEQRLEYEHAYQQEQLGLAQDKLAQTKELNDIKVQEAAKRFAAQQHVQDLIASGTSPAEAMFTEAADLDLGAGDIGALARITRQSAGPNIIQRPEGSFLQTGPESWKPLRIAGAPASLQAQDVPGEGGAPSGIQSVTDEMGKQHFFKKPTEPRPDMVDSPQRVQRRILEDKRRRLEKVVDDRALLLGEVRRQQAEESTKPRAERKKITEQSVRAELEARIGELNKQIEGTSVALKQSKGSGATHRFDPATGKFVPITGTGSSADEEDDDTEGE